MTIRYSPTTQSWLLMAGTLVVAEATSLQTLQIMSIAPIYL